MINHDKNIKTEDGKVATEVVDMSKDNHTLIVRMPDGVLIEVVYYNNTGVVAGNVATTNGRNILANDGMGLSYGIGSDMGFFVSQPTE